jgi:hypothetical protein
MTVDALMAHVEQNDLVKKKGRVTLSHRWSGENPKKIKYLEFSNNTVAFISCRCSYVEATLLAESSILYIIFSPGSLHYDVYR